MGSDSRQAALLRRAGLGGRVPGRRYKELQRFERGEAPEPLDEPRHALFKIAPIAQSYCRTAGSTGAATGARARVHRLSVLPGGLSPLVFRVAGTARLAGHGQIARVLRQDRHDRGNG